MASSKIINEAIRIAGGGQVLAEACGLTTRQAVYAWVRNDIPARHCRAIERLTGIPRHELRPDLFDKPKGTK